MADRQRVWTGRRKQASCRGLQLDEIRTAIESGTAAEKKEARKQLRQCYYPRTVQAVLGERGARDLCGERGCDLRYTRDRQAALDPSTYKKMKPVERAAHWMRKALTRYRSWQTTRKDGFKASTAQCICRAMLYLCKAAQRAGDRAEFEQAYRQAFTVEQNSFVRSYIRVFTSDDAPLVPGGCLNDALNVFRRKDTEINGGRPRYTGAAVVLFGRSAASRTDYRLQRRPVPAGAEIPELYDYCRRRPAEVVPGLGYLDLPIGPDQIDRAAYDEVAGMLI